MHGPRLLALAALAGALMACGASRHPNSGAGASDVRPATRWSASLATPSPLSGAIQITGTALMAPSPSGSSTDVSLTIANATPGAVYPWEVHMGRCDADQGLFGPADAYKPMTVGEDGRASGSASVPASASSGVSYFVSVSASAASRKRIVACGDLTPMAR